MPGDLGKTGIKSMSKVIDGNVDYIKNKYYGVKRRKYIEERILAPDAHPQPHEVLAGLMLVYDMSGTLYPDSHLQEKQ